MNKKARRLVPFFIALIMVIAASMTVSAASRGTDTDVPDSGNTMVMIPGVFEATDVNAVLKLVNSYRKEACDKGYPDPRDPSGKLTSADYKPIKWSGDLEWIAQTRAAEGAVYQSHTRPNGKDCFSCTHNGVDSWGETLAWNYGDLLLGIEQWYEEKADWVAQNSDAVTGHYTAMIDPDTCAIGVGCFTSKSDSWSCIAGEYSSDSTLSASPQTVSGACDQKMEVQKARLSSASISGKSRIAIGTNASYAVSQTVTYPHIWEGYVKTPISVSVTSWASSNTGVAGVSSKGVVTAKKIGKTTITAQLSTGSKVSKAIKITHPVKGDVIIVKGSKYRITKAGSEAAFAGVTKDKATVTIPASVKYYGKTYKVTSVYKNALKGNKRLVTLTVGKNVKSIGTKALYKCNKLKTLKIKSKLIKSGKVGSKAFTGTKIKTVKCPKGKAKLYKKILRKRGVWKKAAFK